MDITEIALRIIADYSLFLIVVGPIGNAISFFVCLRPQLRKVPTFVFYAFLLVCDTVSLFWWNLDHVTIIYGEFYLEDFGMDTCSVVTFFQCFTFQLSAWLLVST